MLLSVLKDLFHGKVYKDNIEKLKVHE